MHEEELIDQNLIDIECMKQLEMDSKAKTN